MALFQLSPLHLWHMEAVLAIQAKAHANHLLEQGEVREQGTHSELLAKRGLYAEMWARQQAEKDEQEPALTLA